MEKLTLEEEAKQLDEEAAALEPEEQNTFLRKGEIMAKMQDQDRWMYVTNPLTGQPYHSFEAWVVFRFPKSRSSAFAAKKAITQVGPHIPRELLASVDRGNFRRLEQLPSSALADPVVQNLAATLPPKEFEVKTAEMFPDHHLESTRPWALKPTPSQASIYDQALDKASIFYGDIGEPLPTREEAMEALCINFINQEEGPNE